MKVKHALIILGVVAIGIALLLPSSILAAKKEGRLILMAGSAQGILDGKVTALDQDMPALFTEEIEGVLYGPATVIERQFGITIDPKQVASFSTEEGGILVSLADTAKVYGLNLFLHEYMAMLTNESAAKAPTDIQWSSYQNLLSDLPKVGTKENLGRLLGTDRMGGDGSISYTTGNGRFTLEDREDVKAADGWEMAVEAPAAASNSLTGDFSVTNIQVEGVDEGDIVKTDGTRIFYGTNHQVKIINAKPSNAMEILATIEFDPEEQLQELFLGEEQLVAITSGRDVSELQKKLGKNMLVLDYSYGKEVVKTYVYNLKEVKHPVLERTVQIDGRFHTARKVDNAFYLIAQSNVPYDTKTKNFDLPVLKDSAIGKERETAYGDLAYFPEALSWQMTNIVGLQLDAPKKEAKVLSYLGGSNNIYMSLSNLYIAAESYHYSLDFDGIFGSGQQTNLYRFSLHNGEVKYQAKGSVPGWCLNQFSLDEHKGYFRVATTDWNAGNSLFVLDANLKQVGAVRNVAPGEQIFSVRYMGNRAYMVTFEVTDPLFAIDLVDPKNPKILGELKIPGFSNYLHPYDENHMMGFGIDTVEENGTAFNQGMKVSLFDVSDMSNPKEMHTVVIGDRGTTSELLQNHRALVFDKTKNLLAFPIQVHMVSAEGMKDVFSYGQFKFQGAYVYSVDLEKGFSFRDRITHLEDHQMNGQAYVQRILYSGDDLYTISNAKIQANSLKDLQKLGTLELK